jgi:hypothetical protein
MADIVPSLFGLTPEMYQQQQSDAEDKRALTLAQLTPFQRAEFNINRGAYNLGQAVGGALGAQDPELQRISQRNAIARQINYNDPASIQQAAQALQQAGDMQGAMMLMQVVDQSLERQDKATARATAQAEREQKAAQLRAQALAQGIAATAYNPGGAPTFYGEQTNATLLDDEGNVMPGAGLTGPSFDIKRVSPQLLALGQPGIAQLEALTKAQQLVKPPEPKYEKAGDIWYKIEPGQAPVAIGGVVKKGEKIAMRDPATGNWSYTTPGAAATETAPGENPINALIAGNAIHPTILPYANQVARSFATLDSEDQDRVMEKLTRLNNSAVTTEANQGERAARLQIAAQSAALTRELTQLRIDAARKAQQDAADGKPLPFQALTKLAGQSDGAVKQNDLLTNFKDNFVGYAFDDAGRIAIAVAGKRSDPDSLRLSGWWQDYQDNINRIRNELFGAALTSTEKTEFDRAMVTPGMSPQAARANLQRQAAAALAAYNKIANSSIANGFSKTAIQFLAPSIEVAAPASRAAAPGAPAAPAAPATALPGGATVRRVQTP